MRKALIVGSVVLCFAASARAENAACWGDDSRGDISCTNITEKLLLSFRGQSEDFVRKAMKAPGRKVENGLHFLNNYSLGEKTGSGDVNVTFEDGRATIVNASVDSPSKAGQFGFVWNAYAAPSLGEEFDRSTKNFARAPFCSDFSGKPQKCEPSGGAAGELSELQMQSGLNKAQLRKELEAACNPGQGLAVSDPAGDCARLRDKLR
jgi:hypothetical protein